MTVIIVFLVILIVLICAFALINKIHTPLSIALFLTVGGTLGAVWAYLH